MSRLAVLVVLATSSFVGWAPIAHAAGSDPGITSGPSAGVTTADPLTWEFTSSQPASCELDRGGTVVSPLADCTSPAEFSVSDQPGGTYTFTVYGAPAADVVVGTTASDTGSVDVAPVAPTITATPTSPGTDTSPSWSFTLPTGATASCAVTDSGGTQVAGDPSCTSPFAPSLAGDPDGRYTFSVTPTAGGVTGDAATSDYDLDTTAPVAPDVEPADTVGSDRSPSFTVTGVEDGATVQCSATGPGAVSVTVSDCSGSPTLDLSGADDGSYTLTVSQQDAAGNQGPDATATYQLDTTAPARPDVTAPSSPAGDRHPDFTVSSSDTPPGTVADYHCSVTGPSTVTASSCGTTTTLDLSGADNGTYQLSVTAVDEAGNESPVGTASYTLEATAPPAPVVTGPATGQETDPSFSYSDSENGITLTYSCSVTGTDPSAAVTGCSTGTPSLDLSASPDGSYTLHVTATDDLGQTSNDGTATYVLDRQPPPAPVVTGPGAGHDVTPHFAVSDTEAGVTYSCTTTPATATVTSCDTTSALDLGGLPDGDYQLSVTATDAAGNSSVGSTTYTLDTAPPPAPSVTAPASANTTQPTFDISEATDSHPVTLDCELDAPGGGNVSSGGCPADGTFDTTGFGDGTYQLTVTATDEAGNTASTTVSWDRDTQPPPVPTVTALETQGSGRSPSFSVTESEAGAQLACTVTPNTAVIVDCGTSPSLDLTGSPDGDYVLSVTATDAAGNQSEPGSATYTLDTTAPTPPVVTADRSVGNATTATFSVDEPDLSDPDSVVSLACSVSPAPAVVTSCGTSSAAISVTGGADGTYTLTVFATDLSGNQSQGSATYTYDTSTPAPDVVAPTSPSNDTSPTFEISDTETGDTLTCLWHGPAGTISNATCPADGILPANAGDGHYALTVTATDAAGNTASAAPVGYDLDTTAPTLSVTPPTSTGNSTTTAFTVHDADATDTLTCTFSAPDGTTLSSAPCAAGGVAVSTGGRTEGDYTFSVSATDTAGNTATATATYALDVTPPASPLVDGPVGPSNDTTPSYTVSPGDLESDVTYVCSVTPSSGSVTSCGSTTTLGLPSSADGTFQLSVQSEDPAGNLSAPTVLSYSLDVTPPPAPSVTPPASAGTTHPVFDISDSETGVTLGCVLVAPGGGNVFSGGCPTDGTFDTTGFGDGTYQLTVTATDEAGNTASTTVGWDRDTQPPPVPTVAASQAQGNGRSPSFSVTESEAGAQLTCSVTPNTVTVLDCGTTPSLDLTGAPDGDYVLSVTATDAAGNQSAPGSATYTLDTTAPTPPVVTANRTVGNATLATFTINEPDLSDPQAGVTLACSASPSPAVVTACGTTSATISVAGGADGTYTLTVVATDLSGNQSQGSATYTFDTSTPTPDVVGPASPSNDTTPTFGFSDTETGDTFSCLWRGPAGTISNTTCPVNATLPANAGDGHYSLTVTATDVAGNSATAAPVGYDLDTTAPTLSVTPPTSTGNSASPAFTVHDADPTDTLTCSFFAPDGTPLSSTPCAAGGVTVSTGGHPEGDYTFSVSATDTAGNTATATATYLLDVTPPASPVVNGPVGPSNNTTPSYTVSPGDGENDVTYVCSVTPSSGTVTSCGTSTRLRLPGGSDGTYQLSVQAQDPAGNLSAPTVLSYSLDVTPPPNPTVIAPASPSKVTSPTFGISDSESGTTLTCVFTSPKGRTVASGSCPVDGTFDTSAFADGTYQLVVTAADAAGNSSQTTVSWTRDTVAPPAPVVVLLTSSPSSVATPSVSVSQGDGTPANTATSLTCTVTGPHGAVGPSGPCVRGQQTFNTAGLGDGSYTFTVVGADAAGNTSSASITYVLDTTTPRPVITVAPSSPSLDPTPTFTITEAESTDQLSCQWTAPDGTVLPFPAGQTCAPGQVALPTTTQNGNYSLTVTATDSASNTASSTATYAYNTTPPTITRSSPTAETFSSPNPTFSIGVSQLASTVTVACALTDSAQPSATVSCTPGTATLHLPAGTDGDYVFSVTVTDNASGHSVATLEHYRLVSSPLTTPDIGLNEGSPNASVTPTWHWSTTDVSTTDRPLTPQCVLTDPLGATTTVDCSSQSSFGTTLTAGPGLYVMSVSVSDPFGNTSPAATVGYNLDPAAGLTPTVSLHSPASNYASSRSPSWNVSGPSGATYDCTLGQSGATPVFDGPCPQQSVAQFGTADGRSVSFLAPFSLAGRPDGAYTLLVSFTDTQGATRSARSSYTLDTTPPARPHLQHAPASPGASTQPEWTFTLPKGARGLCQLIRGGKVLKTDTGCTTSTTFDLSSFGDGTFTVKVWAVDRAGNRSSPLVSTYVLDAHPPARPVVVPPSGRGPVVTWHIHAGAGNRLSCTLSHNGAAVSGPKACSTHPTFHMLGLPEGLYVLSVVQTDSAGARSEPGSASWFFGGVRRTVPPGGRGPTPGGPITPAGPSGPSGHHHPAGPVQPPAQLVGPGARTTPKTAPSNPPNPLAPGRTNLIKVPPQLAQTVQAVVSAVGDAGGGTGFPLILAALVAAFLVAQNRIDRKDPKLAFASVAADDMVEFVPPPSRGDPR